jgi:hypothetical protein
MTLTDRKAALHQEYLNDYHPLHNYKGYTLLIMEDVEPRENRKYYYQLMDPQGKILYYAGKVYHKEKFSDFITKIDKIDTGLNKV